MPSSASYFKTPSSEKVPFKLIVLTVALAHLILIGFILLGSFAKKPQQKITLLQLLPQGSLVKGSPHATPIPSPAPIASVPMQSSDPAPSKPVSKPPNKPVVREPVKKSEVIKPASPQINLTEVKRSITPPRPNLKPISRPATVSPVSTSPSASAASTSASSVNASEIKNRLQTRMGKAGVMSATSDGQSGAWNGSNSSEASAYFVLIRDIYYQTWQQPTADLSQKWAAILKIRVNKQGQVLSAVLEQNSGYAPLDASVKQVAHLVKAIGSPLPDVLGTQFADISIVFEF